MAIPAMPAHGASWDGWAAGIDAAARTAVPKWQPSTAYTAGDIVINPSGQTVTANATFTSGTTYSASNWTIAAGGTGTDATTTSKGVVQLAGDLGGTAASPTVPGLASKLSITTAAATYVAKVDATTLSDTEDAVAGMFTGGTQTGISFTYNSTTKKVNSTVTASTSDATTTTKGVVQLAGDLAGTAAAPTVPGLASKVAALTPTATKTTAYTVAVGELAMMNVAGGATTLTLPTAPADKAQVGYRAIGATAGTPLTINRGGSSDTIGTAGGTSASIPLADETVVLQYDAPNTRWLGIANVRTQASVDARYDASGAAATAQAFAIQRANHTGTQSIGTLSTTGSASSATYLRGDGAWASPPSGGGSAPTVRDALATTSVPGMYAETFPRWQTTVAGGALTSGVPKGSALTLYAGEVVSKLAFMNGGTAMATPSHQWAALCDSSGTVLAISADDTSGAWAATTVKTFTMGSPYTVATSGTYYIFLCVVATTPPGLQAITLAGALANSMTPMISVTAPTNTSTPPTVSSSIGAFTGNSAFLHGMVA